MRKMAYHLRDKRRTVSREAMNSNQENVALNVCKVLLSQALRVVFRVNDLSMQHCDKAVELGVKG